MRIFSVGHSSREIVEFISLLKTYGIKTLVDVRSYPKSSRFPHFSRENLEKALEEAGITYFHLPELGGMRKEGYLGYMNKEGFKRGLERLMELSGGGKTAFMCAEKNWRECHRRFIAEALVKEGFEVLHIIDNKRLEEHPKSLFMTQTE
ncbi:uncharacterized protein DUF488 [Hydrogenivirga caldilitoris]|uniref:Uncharacterized protein DUF488 n=1 Tax=Hydrogenivirga caldilitoris TaxID=246264 RepID=A0A497XUE3_9AQUI|nr:DUF488 domain-containing protein [Hydrogenivirga caldilitoris]RLJ70762.1 uncharacterized protein DUF488 [Hydrogenivirga caldilitoris]